LILPKPLPKKSFYDRVYLQLGKSIGSPPFGDREPNSISGTDFPGGLIFMKPIVEYELLFFTTVANEEKIGSIKKDITEILESLGGKMAGDFSDIGKRKLAYPIKRNTHAFFSFIRFDLDDENRQNIPEIGKRLGLYGNVMRHIIVRAEEIGKPIISGGIKFEQEERAETKPGGRRERTTRPPQVEKAIRPATEVKASEDKSKASLSELDEKLSEILEETPE
jgi:ribosomal protein S6